MIRDDRQRCPSDVDYAGHGLLWDRPTMTNDRYATILADPDDAAHRWAWSRALERLPSRVVTRVAGLAELRRIVSLVKLRPRMRSAWEGALEFWTKEVRRGRPVPPTREDEPKLVEPGRP